MQLFDINKFNELKDLAKTNYESIGDVYCPALKSKVVFNADGFHHLRYDENRSERSKKEQYNKFIFLNNAVDVLKKTTTIQEYRRSICPIGKPDKSGLRKTNMVEWFGFFAIISCTKKLRINVVVRRIGGENGQYHFWSAMPFWRLTHRHREEGSVKLENN